MLFRSTPANSSMKTVEKTGVRYTAKNADEIEAARRAFEDKDLDVVQVGDALHVGKFPVEVGPQVPGGIVQKRVNAASKGLSGVANAGRWETGLEVVPWTNEQGTGQTTRAILERLVDNPDYAVKDAAKRIDAGRLRGSMKSMNEVDRALAAEKNMPIREDLMKLREMLSEVGLEGVIDYVKKTGGVALPAIAAVPTLSSLLSQPDDPEQL